MCAWRMPASSRTWENDATSPARSRIVPPGQDAAANDAQDQGPTPLSPPIARRGTVLRGDPLVAGAAPGAGGPAAGLRRRRREGAEDRGAALLAQDRLDIDRAQARLGGRAPEQVALGVARGRWCAACAAVRRSRRPRRPRTHPIARQSSMSVRTMSSDAARCVPACTSDRSILTMSKWISLSRRRPELPAPRSSMAMRNPAARHAPSFVRRVSSCSMPWRSVISRMIRSGEMPARARQAQQRLWLELGRLDGHRRQVQAERLVRLELGRSGHDRADADPVEIGGAAARLGDGEHAGCVLERRLRWGRLSPSKPTTMPVWTSTIGW